MPMQPARTSYDRRPVPTAFHAGWFTTELQSIQRALPPIGVRTVTTNDTLRASDHVVVCDASVAPLTMTLPNPDRVQFLTAVVKKVDATANVVTLGGVVEGVSGRTLTAQYASLTLHSDGVRWLILAST